ncbi:MAG: S8 family serine peptidase, partial [Gammaproteobacteria bacterium]|nr:S8 family serine peptidase [Gammaproteobacteria bacterium]
VAAASSFDLSAYFEDLSIKLNALIYGSEVVDNLELYKLNYELVNGIYIDNHLWNIISGTGTGTVGTSTDLPDSAVSELTTLESQPEVSVIIQFTKLPSVDTIYQIAELLGGDVFHIDRGINAVALKLVDKPLLKTFITSQASEFKIISVYIDVSARVPEQPNPENPPNLRERPERPATPADGKNNTVDHPDYRPWVGSPSPIQKELHAKTQNDTTGSPIREVDMQPEQSTQANWNTKQINAGELWKEDITGRNVVIAVLDTGVDETHPMLNGSIVGSISMISGETAHDYHGHGTHVAATALGRPVQVRNADGTIIWVNGVAPNAQVLNIKVLGKDGGGSQSGVIKGLDYAATWNDKHPDTPMVVSMSLGSPFGNPNDPISQKVTWLVKEKNIPVVVAAGNEFIVIDSPGLADGAITVAAVDENGEVASFSGKGPGTNYKDTKPDISAPGVKIASARANRGELVEMSGTSMAAPHVAGVVALMLEEHPELADDPTSIKNRIEDTATDTLITPGIWEGAGVIDAYKAVMKPKTGREIGLLQRLFG